MNTIIFDLDETLYDNYENSLFNDTLKILKYLKKHKYRLVLVSYNTSADYLLKKEKIYNYFDLVLFENWRKVGVDMKLKMLSTVLDKLNISPETAVFIDDQQRFLYTAERIGFQTYLANKNTGITFKEMLKIIQN